MSTKVGASPPEDEGRGPGRGGRPRARPGSGRVPPPGSRGTARPPPRPRPRARLARGGRSRASRPGPPRDPACPSRPPSDRRAPPGGRRGRSRLAAARCAPDRRLLRGGSSARGTGEDVPPVSGRSGSTVASKSVRRPKTRTAIAAWVRPSGRPARVSSTMKRRKSRDRGEPSKSPLQRIRSRPPMDLLDSGDSGASRSWIRPATRESPTAMLFWSFLPGTPRTLAEKDDHHRKVHYVKTCGCLRPRLGTSPRKLPRCLLPAAGPPFTFHRSRSSMARSPQLQRPRPHSHAEVKEEKMGTICPGPPRFAPVPGNHADGVLLVARRAGSRPRPRPSPRSRSQVIEQHYPADTSGGVAIAGSHGEAACLLGRT